MSIRNVIILVVITAIFAAVAFTVFQKTAEIESVFITDDISFSAKEGMYLRNEKPVFEKETQIYAVLFVKNMTNESTVNIRWELDNSNNFEPVQENHLVLKEEVSGRIIVSLIKKNNSNIAGNYRVTLSFENQEIIRLFEISA